MLGSFFKNMARVYQNECYIACEIGAAGVSCGFENLVDYNNYEQLFYCNY